MLSENTVMYIINLSFIKGIPHTPKLKPERLYAFCSVLNLIRQKAYQIPELEQRILCKNIQIKKGLWNTCIHTNMTTTEVWQSGAETQELTVYIGAH